MRRAFGSSEGAVVYDSHLSLACDLVYSLAKEPGTIREAVICLGCQITHHLGTRACGMAH